MALQSCLFIKSESGHYQMNCWNAVILAACCLCLLRAISLSNRQDYHLSAGQTTTHTVKLQQLMRYTFVQIYGSAQLKVTTAEGNSIGNHTESLFEGTLIEDMVGKTLLFTISASSPASGYFKINPLKSHQQLGQHQEKLMHLQKGETRIIEIHPKQKRRLIIERFDGVPLFISNLCKNYERKECLDEMHRFTPVPQNKHIEVVPLQPCSNCILAIKITTKSHHARLRLSIDANRTNIEVYPALSLLNKHQKDHIIIKGQLNSSGIITVYSGSVDVSSPTLHFESYANGYTYLIKENQSDDSHIITLTAQTPVSYAMVQSPTAANTIALIDGLPISRFIAPNTNYTITYENFNEGRSNILLSSPSDLLQRLTIRFTDLSSKEHYLIRPKFYFDSPAASQSFQLKPLDGDILIEVHLLSGEGGWLNMTAEVNEHISLPLDYAYSSILHYYEYDDYIIEGIAGTVDVDIRKCADCSLKYTLLEEPISKLPSTPLQGISTRETVVLKGNQLYVRVQTTNFAYYSIRVQKHIDNRAEPTLTDPEIKFYLKEDEENNLLMEFSPPRCSQSPCTPNYYLFQGSDYQHLTSKVYCPFTLFDFDETTKDILFEKIQPQTDKDLLSYTRALKHRDYIGIVAELDGKVLPYRVINTEEVKLYRSMRWPFFYLALFITGALFCAFLVFMTLRRKGQEGYIRTGSVESFS